MSCGEREFYQFTNTMMSSEGYGSDFEKILREDFQKALSELKSQVQFQEEEETKEKCSHPGSISHCGWEVCVSCGKHLRRAKDLFQNDEYEYHDRVLFRDTTPDKTKDMENILHEMITRVGIPTNHIGNILAECKKCNFDEHRKDAIPLHPSWNYVNFT